MGKQTFSIQVTRTYLRSLETEIEASDLEEAMEIAKELFEEEEDDLDLQTVETEANDVTE
jgi:hypothetical protein